MKRQDFVKTLEKFASSKSLDVGRVCEKPAASRDIYEQRALFDWLSDSPFFRNFNQGLKEMICKKLRTEYFSPGDFLMKEGEEPICIYILVKGRVQIHRSYFEGAIATILPKNSVGEHSLGRNIPRQSSVIAETAVTALRLNRDDYRSIAVRQKSVDRYEIINFLKTIPYFSLWPHSRIERLSYATYEIMHSNYTVLYDVGDAPTDMYLIK